MSGSGRGRGGAGRDSGRRRAGGGGRGHVARPPRSRSSADGAGRARSWSRSPGRRGRCAGTQPSRHGQVRGGGRGRRRGSGLGPGPGGGAMRPGRPWATSSPRAAPPGESEPFVAFASNGLRPGVSASRPRPRCPARWLWGPGTVRRVYAGGCGVGVGGGGDVPAGAALGPQTLGCPAVSAPAFSGTHELRSRPCVFLVSLGTLKRPPPPTLTPERRVGGKMGRVRQGVGARVLQTLGSGPFDTRS